MLKSTCTLSGSKFDAPQGEEAVLPEQMDAAVRLALDRQSMFYEDKEAADGLCRTKKEKKTKKESCHAVGFKISTATVEWESWGGCPATKIR